MTLFMNSELEGMDSMRKENIESLAEFVSRISVYDILSHHAIFRGQPVAGSLLPSIARASSCEDTTNLERAMLAQFKRIGVTKISAHNSTVWDHLVLAQHFGMKTRLLDWSTNPLVALYFACSGSVPGDVYVYSLLGDKLLLESSDADPFQPERTWVIYPDLSNERIIAQHGCFTAHAYSKKSQCWVPLEKNKTAKAVLTEYRVPANKREEIQKELDRCGINQPTLFPDLEGLGRYLNWRAEKQEIPYRK